MESEAGRLRLLWGTPLTPLIEGNVKSKKFEVKMWYKEIDYKKFLTGDLKIIEEEFGIDILMRMYELFGKTNIYFSEKPLIDMKIEYIKKKLSKNYNSDTLKKLCREMHLSERIIHKILEKRDGK
jgi:hypothetical protein